MLASKYGLQFCERIPNIEILEELCWTLRNGVHTGFTSWLMNIPQHYHNEKSGWTLALILMKINSTSHLEERFVASAKSFLPINKAQLFNGYDKDGRCQKNGDSNPWVKGMIFRSKPRIRA